MIEFWRQYVSVTVLTGAWSHFQIYVMYAWTVMLPRALGAGVFYSFRPAKPTKLTVQYGLALILALVLFIVPTVFWAKELISGWYVLAGVVVGMLLVAPPVRRRIIRFTFQSTYYAKHVRIVPQEGPVCAQRMVAMMTIFDEDPDFLDRSLRNIRRSLGAAPGDFVLIAIIDGYGNFQHAEAAIPVAKRHCDIVMTTNAQKKRAGLEAMGLEAYSRGLITTGEEIIHLIDSDTKPASDQVASELNRPFADQTIGGVTTAQYIDNPQSFAQHVMQIFETIRNFGSQAFMSLFGSIGCLPGRWYAVRAKYLTKEVFHDLNSHSFSWFGLFRHISKAGDDRHITEAVLKAGGKTILAPDAVVFTGAPYHFNDMRKMVTRWARSSNGYTFRAWWLFRPAHWATAFVYWGNIGLAFGTVYIVFPYLLYQFFFGDRDILLIEAALFMFLSMAMTMTFRFIPVWSRQLYYLLYMPVMGFVGIFMQVIQVVGIVTHVHKIGNWDTRGADVGAKDIKPMCKVIYVRPTT
ncbi:glycosyltransferase [Candidatus Kaiserbacteria bacterium]|nr:glycosyltransferase [Candidatus Kaiserbacteria bacterium]MCB9812707.1 glycosyltransferase [Candidatus Nomurabacteria bacterium]